MDLGDRALQLHRGVDLGFPERRSGRAAWPAVKDIFLLADSRLLFARVGAGPFVHRVAAEVHDQAWRDGPRAAYLGASNGDRREFYELFRAAMEPAGITRCHHVHADPSAEERAALDAAHLILLAGGDVDAGWQALVQSGVAERIRERAAEDAVLVGISAGAVQIGGRGASGIGLGLVPFQIDVHDGPSWTALERRILASEPGSVGIGIPAGGGIAYRAVGEVEPIAQPCVELLRTGEGIRRNELVPGPTGLAREG